MACMVLMVNFGANNVIDIVCESIITQQARVDPENGPNDLQSLRLMFYGAGVFFGCAYGAFATEYYTAYYIFFLCTLMSFLITFSGFMVSDNIETNEYAQMRDPVEIEEEQRQLRDALISDNQSLFFRPKIGCFRLMQLKFKRLYKNCEEPSVYSLFLYTFLQGLQPNVETFEYYFVLNELKISKFVVGIAPMITGFFVFVGPLFYNKLLSNYEYSTMFKMMQGVEVFQVLVGLVLSTRTNASLGRWSDFALYFIGGSLATSL